MTGVNLSDIAAGNGGFVINGECTNDVSGHSVSFAGDVNGDGLDDLIVGAWSSSPNGQPGAGRSYVVFGQTGTTAIDPAAVIQGSGGFAINGESDYDLSGYSVSSAGDINGDGLGDLLVGAIGSDPNGKTEAGRVYVVFGQTGPTAIELTTVAAGKGGFVINGKDAHNYSGRNLAAAGDVNGDGLCDLIVGAWGGFANSNGHSYVVFGKSDGNAINLSAVAKGRGGYILNGWSAFDNSGWNISDAGDVNGDGLADQIFGASSTSHYAGHSYVVFGRSSSAGPAISLSALGSNGFVINGESAGDSSGHGISSAGDINGDGLSDLFIGASGSDPNGHDNAGRSYVVFGTTSTTAIDLSAVALGSGGFAIDGEAAGDISGNSISAAGDINGDGLADLIVGAEENGASDISQPGGNYVIFGSTGGAFSASTVDSMGTAGDDSLTGTTDDETIVAGAGSDTLTGNGGADVLYGGAGNDSFVLNADNLAKLSAGITNGNYARVDGGSGIDTIRLEGSDIALDLRTVANQGGARPGSSSRIESIERIDLSGSGNNSLTLRSKDVADMAGMNIFNDGNGWTGLGATVRKHQLVIDGNAGDTVTLVNDTSRTGSVLWSYGGSATHDGRTYNVFNTVSQTGKALWVQVLIDAELDYPDAVRILVSAGNNDKYVGTAADERLAGSANAGKDRMAGGGGNDTYVVDNLKDRITEHANAGIDAVEASISYKLGKNLEKLILIGTDNIDGTGNALANVLIGNDGNNRLDGGKDSDTLAGGLGDDIYLVDASGDVVTEAAGEGTDWVKSGLAAYTLTDNVENLTLTGNAAKGAGNADANVLTGNDKANTLDGGAGDDTLDGGKGKDVLIGGDGADVFVFDAALKGNIDTLSDFASGTDQLQLSASIFTMLAGDTDLSDNFVAAETVKALDDNDYLLFDSKTGALYYDADGSGKGQAAIQFASLVGVDHAIRDIVAADFVLE